MPQKSALLVRLAALVLLACGDDSAALPHAPDARVPARADAAVDASRPIPTPTVDADVEVVAAEPPDDAGSDGEVPSLQLESVTTTLDDGEVLIEKVSYRSEGLRIFGQICRPHPAGKQGPGPFPIHVMNHGGFSGITDWNGGNCLDAARSGFVAAESSYRGENGSDGQVEVCLGEVTDVLRLLELVRALPYAQPERVLMSGLSHGGCITLRALQRGAPVQLAVDIFGPTDWARAYTSWKQALQAGSPNAVAHQSLVSALELATGGSPSDFPEAYRQRSPVTFSAELAAATAPLLIVQGTADLYVPTSQACALADVAAGFQRYHVDVLGAVQPSAPAGCSASWLPGPRPSTSWPSARTLIVYDGVGHNFEGLATSYLIADMTAFLSARFPK